MTNVRLSFQGTKIRHDRSEALRKQAIKERQALMKQKVRPNKHKHHTLPTQRTNTHPISHHAPFLTPFQNILLKPITQRKKKEDEAIRLIQRCHRGYHGRINVKRYSIIPSTYLLHLL